MSARRTMILSLFGIGMAIGLVASSTIAQSNVAEAFAAIVAITLVIPPLMTGCRVLSERVFVTTAVVAAVAILLLLTMSIPIVQCVACVAIVAAYAAFVLGLCFLARGPGIVIVAIVLMLWISWPIWLSGRLAGHDLAVDRLAVVHPLLTLNGQLIDQAIWTERPLMYGWTGLNQDVPFSMPMSIWPCVLWNSLLGLGLLAAVRFLARHAGVMRARTNS